MNNYLVEIHTVHEARSWKQQGYFRSRKRFFGKNYIEKLLHKEICTAPANTMLSLRQCYYSQEL